MIKITCITNFYFYFLFNSVKNTVNSGLSHSLVRETPTSVTISNDHSKRIHVEEQFPLEEDAELNQVSTPYIKVFF